VRHDDGGATVGQDLLQGGQGTADAGVVSDVAILIEGYVEVYTYDCLLTGKVEFVDCHHFDLRFNIYYLFDDLTILLFMSAKVHIFNEELRIKNE